MPTRIFITVAEVSGDRHAAQLIRSLKELDPAVVIEGIGGPEMAAAGAVIHRDMVAKAAMGWRGALRAFEIHGILRWTRRHFASNRPDLWIGVDSPSMNFHFARAAKEAGIPTLQYVAPQLWAWAPKRMKKLRKWVDQVACILPFEESYFRSHGVNATFVGHPLFDELPSDREVPPEEKFPNRPPIIGLLPGSRRSEAESNFPGLFAAAATIRQAFPDVTFLVPTTRATHPVIGRTVMASPWKSASEEVTRAGFSVQKIARQGVEALNPVPAHEAALGPHPVHRDIPIAEAPPQPGRDWTPRTLWYGEACFDEMVPHCDLCLTVSGTATVHVAAFGVPMIVVYRIHRAAWHLVGRWLVPTRTFAMINVLAARRETPPGVECPHVVKEFVPWFGESGPLADVAIDYLRHPEKLAELARTIRSLLNELDRPGASMAVARMAFGMLSC